MNIYRIIVTYEDFESEAHHRYTTVVTAENEILAKRAAWARCRTAKSVYMIRGTMVSVISEEPKMKEYQVNARYFRPSGTDTMAVVFVEANSPTHAKKLAKAQLTAQPQRSIASWGKIDAILVADNRPTFLPQQAPAPIREGDTVTVAIPFTGKFRHLDGDKVELVGEQFPQGTARRRMPRAYLEELTGRKIEAKITYQILVVYPDGTTYVQSNETKSSMYGLDQLIQIRVGKQNGKIVSKEIV